MGLSAQNLRYALRQLRKNPGLTVVAVFTLVAQDADPNLPVGTVTSMDDIVLSTLGGRLFETRALGVFAVLAMLMSAVGVYGVISHNVGERRREPGIRMALGARADQVARLTFGNVLKLVVPGVVLGGMVAIATSRLIAASLYDVPPHDPATFLAISLLLSGVAVRAATA